MIKMKRPRYIVIGGDIADAGFGTAIIDPDTDPNELSTKTPIVLNGRITFEIYNQYENLTEPFHEVANVFAEMVQIMKDKLSDDPTMTLDDRIEFITFIGDQYTKLEPSLSRGNVFFIGSTGFMIISSNVDGNNLGILSARIIATPINQRNKHHDK